MVRELAGVWEGEGIGFGQTSQRTHKWEFILDGTFLRFRQFLSEGLVDTFKLEEAVPPQRGGNFEPEGTEGLETTSVRMTIRFQDVDSYEMVLELGTKGEELKACQTMKLRKVN